MSYKLHRVTDEERSLLDQGKLLPLMEDFYTIQGEGFNSGKAAYFIRIGGCDVGCHWCDVKESWDASVHPLTTTDAIVQKVMEANAKAVVVTGGEPLQYQLDHLTAALKDRGIKTFIETSGAYPLSGDWDWICLSPKKTMAPLDAIYPSASELKIIVHNRHDLVFAEEQAKRVGKDCYLFLQPEWSKRLEMMPLIIDYVKAHPEWMISIQTHKYMNIP